MQHERPAILDSFLSEARARVARMEDALGLLGRDPRDIEAIRALRLHFFLFSRLGEDHGLPSIAGPARRGDRDITAVLIEGGRPGPERVRGWKKLLSAISAAVEALDPAMEAHSRQVGRLLLVSLRGGNLVRDREDGDPGGFLAWETVESAIAAASAFEKGACLAVVLDLAMPRAESMEVLAAVRARSGGTGPVVGLAGRLGVVDRYALTQAGVRVILPEAASSAEIASAVQRLRSDQTPVPGTVFLLGPDPDSWTRMTQDLQAEGYRVAVFPDIVPMLRAWLDGAPDMIVVAAARAGTQAERWIRDLREDRHASSLPLVAAVDSAGARQAMIDAGADDWILVPYASREFAARVRGLLDRGRLLGTAGMRASRAGAYGAMFRIPPAIQPAETPRTAAPPDATTPRASPPVPSPDRAVKTASPDAAGSEMPAMARPGDRHVLGPSSAAGSGDPALQSPRPLPIRPAQVQPRPVTVTAPIVAPRITPQRPITPIMAPRVAAPPPVVRMPAKAQAPAAVASTAGAERPAEKAPPAPPAPAGKVEEPPPAPPEPVASAPEPPPSPPELVMAVEEPPPAPPEPVMLAPEPPPIPAEPVKSVEEPPPAPPEPVASAPEPPPIPPEPVKVVGEPPPAPPEPMKVEAEPQIPPEPVAASPEPSIPPEPEMAVQEPNRASAETAPVGPPHETGPDEASTRELPAFEEPPPLPVQRIETTSPAIAAISEDGPSVAETPTRQMSAMEVPAGSVDRASAERRRKEWLALSRLFQARGPVRSGSAKAGTPTVAFAAGQAEKDHAGPSESTSSMPPLVHPTSPQGALPGAPVRVLVADSDRVVIELLTHQFHRRGWQVVTASDGVSAEKILRADREFTFAMLDIGLPGRTGIDLLESMKIQGWKCASKVVVLSGGSSDDDMNRCLALGADEVMIKPLNPPAVAARLLKMIGKPPTPEE